MHASERLDELATPLVPILYLAGMVGGTVAYFSGIDLGAAAVVGFAVGIASELHAFLANRRMRADLEAWTRASDYDVKLELRKRFWMSAGTLGGILLFQCWNGCAFWATHSTPIPGYGPTWLQVGLRGCVLPVLLFLASFLTPLHTAQPTAGQLIQAQAHKTLRYTIRTDSRSFKRRVKRTLRKGGNLSGLVADLLANEGDHQGAGIWRIIQTHLDAKTSTSAAEMTATPSATPEPPTTPPTPPSGPERPTGRRTNIRTLPTSAAVIALSAEPESQRSRRAALNEIRAQLGDVTRPTYDELLAQLQTEYGMRCSRSTLSTDLAAIDWTRRDTAPSTKRAAMIG